MPKIPIKRIPVEYKKEKSTELEFDIRDVQTPNPRTVNKVPSYLFRRDHLIPRKYKVKKKWWNE